MTKKELETELKRAYDCGYRDKGVRDYGFHQHSYKLLDDFDSRTCKTCKYWIRSANSPELMRCGGSNGCELTGENFFCANWEVKR